MQKALQQKPVWRLWRVSAPRTATDEFKQSNVQKPIQELQDKPRSRSTHIARKHRLKSKQTWEACRLYLHWKRFVDVSSVALYPVTQVFWSWAREAATQSLTRLEVLRSARWPKLSQCLKAAERMRQVQTRPRTGRSQVSVQSTLTSKEKYSDSNQTPKSLLPT